MKMEQVHEFVNTTTTEILGEEGLVNEDLSNIVDVGEKIINANAIENFTKKLVDHIGKVKFVNRNYAGSAPKVLMDGWEYGSILEKVSGNLPEATENESWKLENGKSYDPNVFYQPEVQAKFFNDRVTFEIDQSFTEKQVKSSFSNGTQMNGFLSMLDNEVQKSLTVKTDSLIMRTINNMTGMTINNGGVRVVNLLQGFNNAYKAVLAAPLKEAEAIYDKDFLRYASYVMSLFPKRLAKINSLYNIGGMPRFTPKDKLHTILLDEFVKSAEMYMESDTFHNELVALPTTETVSFWQGCGEDYSFANTSKIDVTVRNPVAEGTVTVSQSGILGVMFDREALGVANVDRRVTTHWNPKAEFFTNFHKFDAGYFNDADEQFVVFTASDVA